MNITMERKWVKYKKLLKVILIFIFYMNTYWLHSQHKCFEYSTTNMNFWDKLVILTYLQCFNLYGVASKNYKYNTVQYNMANHFCAQFPLV
jgi:hypothetical protein